MMHSSRNKDCVNLFVRSGLRFEYVTWRFMWFDWQRFRFRKWTHPRQETAIRARVCGPVPRAACITFGTAHLASFFSFYLPTPIARQIDALTSRRLALDLFVRKHNDEPGRLGKPLFG